MIIKNESFIFILKVKREKGKDILVVEKQKTELQQRTVSMVRAEEEMNILQQKLQACDKEIKKLKSALQQLDQQGHCLHIFFQIQ